MTKVFIYSVLFPIGRLMKYKLLLENFFTLLFDIIACMSTSEYDPLEKIL